jgi:hypothetical protein
MARRVVDIGLILPDNRAFQGINTLATFEYLETSISVSEYSHCIKFEGTVRATDQQNVLVASVNWNDANHRRWKLHTALLPIKRGQAQCLNAV